MSTSSRVVKNTAFLYFRLGISLIVSLWTTRIVLNALGVDNFGIYSVVGGVIALLGFLNATLSSATQRFINIAEGQNDFNHQVKIFNNSFILHLCLAGVLMIVLAIAGIICFNGLLDIPEDRINAAIYVYACMIVTTVLSVLNVPYEASINAHEDMQYYAYIGLIEVLTKLGIAYLIKDASCDRLILYASLMMIVPLLTFALMRIYCQKRYTECKLKINKSFDKNIIKELGSFAGWNFTNSASGIITQYGLNIVINHFYGVVLNAAQGIAIQVSGVLLNLSSNALKALNPIILKSEGANDRNRMIYVSLLGCRVSYFIFTLFSIPLVSVMGIILKIWLTDVPDYAVIFCQLQLIRICIEMLTYSMITSIMAEGNIKRYNIYRSIINFLPLICTVILFKLKFAPYWMYIVWIICWSVIGGLNTIFFAHKNLGMHYSLFCNKVLIPSFYATIVPIFLITVSYHLTHTISLRILIVGVSTIIFIFLSWHALFFQKERDALKLLVKTYIYRHKNA